MKKIRVQLFLTIIVLSVLLQFPQSLEAQENWYAILDGYVEKAIQNWKVPGLSVAIIKDDSVVFARGYGILEMGKKDKVDAHTLFAVASNTKGFTAALLGMLVDEGKLQWDDRVIDYLPSFQMFDPYITREIRIRDLLTHQSGLPTFGGDRLWIGTSNTSEEIISRIRYLEPSAPFRTQFQYQNLMYMVAGQVAAAVTGQTWDEAVQERIFKPLTMHESNTSIRDLKSKKNVAIPHEVVGGKQMPIAYDNVDGVAPAAAINSNVLDMAQWMRFQLGDGSFQGKRIISSRRMREMHAVQFPLPVSQYQERVLGAYFSGYGLGWFLSQYKGHKTVSPGGGLSGMISLQTLVPDLNLGIMILSNSAPDSPTNALTYYIMDHFLDQEERDWSGDYLAMNASQEERIEKSEKELQDKRIKGTRPSHGLSSYAGTYSEPVTGEIEIKLEKGKLVFDYNPRYLGDLEHWHYDTFRVHWRHPIFDMDSKSFLTFRTDEEGNISGFTVTFYHRLEFVRVDKSVP
jgi:CubicO group peptidase (beta-lactamase class C family)